VSADAAALRDEIRLLTRSIDDAAAEHERGELGDADYEAIVRRDGARLEAARQRLGELEGGHAASPAAEPAAPPAPAAESRRRRPKWLLVLAVACLLVAVAIPVLASRRSGQAPITVTPAARVQVLLLAAEQELAEGQSLRALTAYDAVLRLAPDNAEALAESGWLRYEAAAGSNDPKDEARGEAQLRRAIVVAPGQAAGHLYLGIVLLDHDRDPAAALAQLKIAAGLPESAAEQNLTAAFLALASRRAR
jgi:hypothetical protein